MGCDIHTYIDYDTDRETTYCDHFGKVDVSRDYYLFGLMAGVRDSSVEPVIEPRGIPERISLPVLWDLTLRVLDSEDICPEGCCTRESADSWHESFSKEPYQGYYNGDKNRVFSPDWHTHSWMSLFDLKQVVERYPDRSEKDIRFHNKSKPIPEGWKECEMTLGLNAERTMIESITPLPLKVPGSLMAIQGAMEGLVRAGHEPRLVFWFDN